jgi:hypothetical protein
MGIAMWKWSLRAGVYSSLEHQARLDSKADLPLLKTLLIVVRMYATADSKNTHVFRNRNNRCKWFQASGKSPRISEVL